MNLSYAQALVANFTYQGDPSWIITIGPMSFTSWDGNGALLKEDEQNQSQIDVTLANPNQILSGVFGYGMPMTLRFGYGMNFSPTAHLPVAQVKEKYSSSDHMTVTVTGRDDTQKMSGGNNKGNHGKKSDRELIKDLLQSRGLSMSGNSDSVSDGCKGALMNESDRAAAYRLGNAQGPGSSASSSGSGTSPASPYGTESSSTIEGQEAQRDAGYTFSSAEGWGEKKGKGRDKNRGGNHSGRQSQAPIKAKLVLRGFPTIRACGNVGIAGVKGKASGTYYVKTVETEWENKGMITTLDMERGGTGSGGVGGSAPVIMRANIWQQGEVYLGPRQSFGMPQATFIYGQDAFWMDFEYIEAPQSSRGGGEGGQGGKSKGESHDLRDRLKPISTEDSGASSGQGGSTATGAPSSGQ
jgi:hypothetical protein